MCYMYIVVLTFWHSTSDQSERIDFYPSIWYTWVRHNLYLVSLEVDHLGKKYTD